MSTFFRRTTKFVHEVGSVGVIGALASCVVLVAKAPSPAESLIGYAAVRQGIANICTYVLMPSLALVLISGLLAIAINRAFHNAGWAWVKALTGISMFEGTLLTVNGSAQQAAQITALAASGKGDLAHLAEVVRTEWGGLWIIMAVAIANILLAVWRPRLTPRSRD